MLTNAIIFERVEPIPRWYAEVGQLRGRVDRFQLAQCPPREVGWYTLRLSGPEEFFGRTVCESLDHTEVYCVT